MSSPIGTLPNELLLEVFKYLRHHDLTQLMRVSRQFHKLIEPTLWAKIELHHLSFHEDYVFEELREEEATLQRPYQLPGHIPDWEWIRNNGINEMERDQDEKTKLFLGLFFEKNIADRERAEHLAKLVRWLCLPVNGENIWINGDNKLDPWNALAMFTNLEYLEISAFWKSPTNIVPFKGSEKTMAKLKTLKLRGFLPAEFVRHACANASGITELQLAVLDVPVGSSLHGDDRENPPPEPGPTDEEDEDAEDLDREMVAPRPLACLTPEIISQFTSLTCLSLVRPCQAYEVDEHSFGELYVSVKSDTRVLNEWAALIRANRGALTHLTLDQRPVAEENEPDGTGNAEFMEKYCNGPGYQRFVEIVLPALLEDAEWPNLKSIRLFGFETDNPEERENSVNLVEKLKEWFGEEVEVVNALGRRIVFEESTGLNQVEGDVLDSLNGFDEDGEERIRGRPWQCQDANTTGDWTFGRLPRLA